MSRLEEIVDVAAEVIEKDGVEALTMRRVAAELGIQAPSLYKHVAGRDDILGALQTRAIVSLGHALTRAAAADGPAVVAMARAYRAWAHEHPAQYDLMMRRPVDRDRLGVQEQLAEAPVLAAMGGDRARARALWAVAHGLVDLERAGRFPADADLDAAWATATAAFGSR